MPELFRLGSDRAELRLSGLPSKGATLGHLKATLRRAGAVLNGDARRAGVPDVLANAPEASVGPTLAEETPYTLVLRSAHGHVEARHRDPTLLKQVNRLSAGDVFYQLNFRGQVGRSKIFVWLNGKPEFEVEVEVMPSKLDYADDYYALLADVQDTYTALALEYLRATYQQASFTAPENGQSELEWLLLLRHVYDDLERALVQIAGRPIRSLLREPIPTLLPRLKRVDSGVRRAILQGKGVGPRIFLGGTIVRSRIEERRAQATLDTPEHRWLAAQLRAVRQRVAQIAADVAQRKTHYAADSATDRAIQAELDVWLGGLNRLIRAEPIAAAKTLPPAGFTSLQLQTAPGYREAYKACLLLRQGLRIDGGPLETSVKDLHLLYEYWCYIGIVRTAAELLGEQIPWRQMIEAESDGLRIRLRRGHEHTVRLSNDRDRSVEITYNPKFQGADYLLPQQPDIVVTLREQGWPAARLVLDAKYRLTQDADYVAQYGSAGPPPDAINVLHRYRDAIVERLSRSGEAPAPRRTVIEGAALFPFTDKNDAYHGSKLWRSLDALGIGALPFLPGETRYVREWLTGALKRSGWEIADKLVPQAAPEALRRARDAANEVALIGVLRGGGEAEHLEWIVKQRCYYMPYLPSHGRPLQTRVVAIHVPAALRQPGAITMKAQVTRIEVVSRGEIATPWEPGHGRAELHVVYHLEPMVELPEPIEAEASEGVRRPRWTTRLGLERATSLSQLALETEPEWRLFDGLVARGVRPQIKAGGIRDFDDDDPRGRAIFSVRERTATYNGAAGFRLRSATHERYVAAVSEAIDYLGSADLSH